MNRLLACLFLVVAFQATAAAHVLDEYVQAAQLSLAPDGVRVEMRLVPGVEVAHHVLKLIDLDRNGQISPVEEQAYARRVLQDVSLTVDGQLAPLALTSVEFPSWREMNEGTGAIRLDLKAEAVLRAAGEHQVSFRNDHLPKLGVYLINALVPATSEIKINGQTRDQLQHEMLLSFQVSPYVAAVNPQVAQPWIGALIFCGSLMLLFLLCKQLRQYVRRRQDKQISDSTAAVRVATLSSQNPIRGAKHGT